MGTFNKSYFTYTCRYYFENDVSSVKHFIVQIMHTNYKSLDY